MRRIILSALFPAILILSCACACAESTAEFEASGEGIYNYCPAAFEEDGVRHIYYCTNTKAREIVDSIGFRTAVSVDGKWVYSDETIVLERTKFWKGWDTNHACDPDVIKGSFMYKEEEYSYLMAYLGCTTTNNQNNEIGLAASKTPSGPFIKIDEINPIVPFERDKSTAERDAMFQWGVGQAALISIDKAGQVLLLYTSGRIEGTYLFCERWDFSDLEHPRHLGDDWRNRVTIAGLMGRDMGYASLNNADAVYDAESGHIYLAADGWPCYIEGVDEPGEPTFINSTVRVLRYTPAIEPDELRDLTFSAGAWEQVALITSADSGFPRNHNPGLVHDPYGWALSSDALDVLYSVSEVKQPSNSLWTYRIHRLTVDLNVTGEKQAY
ncbi:MAG: hypothetical protein LBD16_00090 [Oscillospiraceae bacterium]|jgi:hypothetical protein|nr:hypothetical protein [Oscillospiraceae bacterium]